MRDCNEAIHWELHDIWNMIETVDGAIPLDKRPDRVQLLTSLGNQKIPVQGNVNKDPVECSIAASSC